MGVRPQELRGRGGGERSGGCRGVISTQTADGRALSTREICVSLWKGEVSQKLRDRQRQTGRQRQRNTERE